MSGDFVDRIMYDVRGDKRELFTEDMNKATSAVDAAIRGKRVLVAGGAGSIGSAVIQMVIGYDPAALVVIDPAENNLVELVRDIRCYAPQWRGELAVSPLEYGSPTAYQFIASQAPFDLVLSFAAIKHVRSERDRFSLARMVSVNVAQFEVFLRALSCEGHGKARVFSCSTDKAADPVNCMGATKNFAEQVLWQHRNLFASVTTARFANVAFSDGSLPHSFLQRIKKGQPLSAPGDVRRHMITHREAARLCLIAACAVPTGYIVVPKLDEAHLVSFVDLARATIAAYRTEECCPLTITTTDTPGEKTVESFVGSDETAVDIGFPSLSGIFRSDLSRTPRDHYFDFSGMAERIACGKDQPHTADIEAMLCLAVSSFKHKAGALSLDAKA